MGKSSIEQPVNFFEEYFSEQGLDLLKESFYTEYSEHENACTIDRENNSVTYYNSGINVETGKQLDEWETRYFENELKNRLIKELNVSKRLIGKSIARVPNPKDFLQIQLNVLIQIQSESVALYSHYPFSEDIVNALIKYIERKIKPGNTNELLVNVGIITKNKSLFNYKGNLSNLKKMKVYLEDEKQYINSTDDFIKIFTQQQFSMKINWIVTKNSLHYFIDRLSECWCMDFDKEERWIITAKCFKWKGNDIDNEDIKANSKDPQQAVMDIIKEAMKLI